MPALPVVVVADVDPDWRAPGMSGKPYLGELGWRGVTEGIPRMLDLVRGLRDSEGGPVRFTWLLRSDQQMAALTGDPAFVASHFESLWRERASEGDEIGWHPHLWRWSEREHVWYQESQDDDWIRRCLTEGHAALARRFPVRTAKSGWTYHDNRTIQVLSDLGITVDVSALPGMRYEGGIAGMSRPLGAYDWSRAPQEPYHPSRGDYQVPGNGHSLPILELPNWTFPIGWIRSLYHRARGRSWRDFANPAKAPPLVSEGFAKPPWTTPFVCYFHPEELLGTRRLFRAEHVARNLRTLLDACRDRGSAVKFVTASAMAEVWS